MSLTDNVAPGRLASALEPRDIVAGRERGPATREDGGEREGGKQRARSRRPCFMTPVTTERGLHKTGRNDGKQGSTTESVRWRTRATRRPKPAQLGGTCINFRELENEQKMSPGEGSADKFRQETSSSSDVDANSKLARRLARPYERTRPAHSAWPSPERIRAQGSSCVSHWGSVATAFN